MTVLVRVEALSSFASNLVTGEGKMKASRMILAAMILFGAASFAQQNCAYTFTWTKPPSFSFCITPYGTIGMIQSPAGTNHLDGANPVEGFAWFIADSGGGTSSGAQIPGLGLTDLGVASFSQPKGPGTLPLVANFEGGFGFGDILTITADPTQRSITIKHKITDCGFNCEWEGYISRAAKAELDGTSTNNFGSSAYAGFAFLNHGLMLSMPEVNAKGVSGGCGGIDPAGVSQEVYVSCGGSSFKGTGGIYADAFFNTMHGHSATLTFTYRVF